MQPPDDLDDFLTQLLQRPVPLARIEIDGDDRAFIAAMLAAIGPQSRGVFIVVHPDERLEYLLVKTDLLGALGLLTAVLTRTLQAFDTPGA